MKKIQLSISKGQFLKDILKTIQSHSIYFKRLPAIGATTNELEALRWSLIMEPNLPVIKGKKSKSIFGVHEGIYVDDVINYLLNDKIVYKKIMVTPESFFKVKEACEILEINIYQKFFFLFDECDRTMKDVAFRKSIVLPMNDFFKFDQKAFISATAVIPSDPRFDEQDFQHVFIEPTFDYSKEIDLIVSNNVSVSLKTIIENHNGAIICVFLNSIKAITATIADLDIKDRAHIYCSREKMYPLRAEKYHAYDNIDERHNASINFYTSRFNAAVDINLDHRPIVVLTTNLHYAHHTMIDPRSEAIQIIGRFRKGVSKLYAVTNIASDLPVMTESESISFLAGCEQSYSDIRTLRNSTQDIGAIKTLNEALDLVTYSNFVSENGTKNYYMFDNFLYQESVKQIFTSNENILEAYTNSHFKPTLKLEAYEISDADYKVAKNGISMLTLVTAVADALTRIQQNHNGNQYVIDNRDAVLSEIQKCYPAIYDAYFILGQSDLLKNAYSIKQINKAVKARKTSIQKSNFSFIEDLQEAFPDEYEASTAVIKATMLKIIESHGSELRPEIKLLEEYFKLSPRKSLKGKQDEKGYKILQSKFNRKGQ